MAWPTLAGTQATNPLVSPYLKSYGTGTYLYWGTAGTVGESGGTNPTNPGYYVVTRISQKRKKEDLPYENGDGVQCGLVTVFHGTTWEVTIRADSRQLAAANFLEGAVTVYICDMMNMLGGGVNYLYSARVLDTGFDTAPKQPGERTLTLEKITLINP